MQHIKSTMTYCGRDFAVQLLAHSAMQHSTSTTANNNLTAAERIETTSFLIGTISRITFASKLFCKSGLKTKVFMGNSMGSELPPPLT